MSFLTSRARTCALAAVFVPFVACSQSSNEPVGDAVGTGDESLVDVEQTGVKNQSIGNCWIYATAGWAESLHKAASGEELDISETYWTYWHFFEQITSGRAGSSVETGGFWRTATGLASRYGIMLERDFVRSEAKVPRSTTQRNAETRINEALANGALKAAAARGDRALVRAELDRAFGLAPEVVRLLDDVFGRDVSRTLAGVRHVDWTPPPLDAGVPEPTDAAVPDAAVPDAAVPDAAVPDAESSDATMVDAAAPDASESDASESDASESDAESGDAGAPDASDVDATVSDAGAPAPEPPAPPKPYFEGTPIRTVYEVSVRVPDPTKVRSTQLPLKGPDGFVTVTLADVLPSFRARYGWTEVRYPRSSSGRRQVQQRIQRALHDRQPVIVGWFVDFAYQSGATFRLPEVLPKPGRQGGHLVVAEDYQVDTGSSFGVLAAGTTLDVSNPENDAKFLAALAPTSTFQFLRIKNSWGTRESAGEGFGGYFDLYTSYLDARIPLSCADVEDAAERASCEANPGSYDAFTNVVLPAGY